jgi:hypothetical protein
MSRGPDERRVAEALGMQFADLDPGMLDLIDATKYRYQKISGTGGNLPPEIVMQIVQEISPLKYVAGGAPLTPLSALTNGTKIRVKIRDKEFVGVYLALGKGGWHSVSLSDDPEHKEMRQARISDIQVA